jgi:hypothetical protein
VTNGGEQSWGVGDSALNVWEAFLERLMSFYGHIDKKYFVYWMEAMDFFLKYDVDPHFQSLQERSKQR